MLKRVHQDEPNVHSLRLSEAFTGAINNLSIGRDTTSHFALHCSRCPLLLSRNHAQLTRTGQHLELEDLSSTNGTFVNERRLAPHERCRLKEGDVVSFGGTLRVRAAESGREEDNPFVFKVKHLQRILQPPAERDDQRHALPTQTYRDEFIDLTALNTGTSSQSPGGQTPAPASRIAASNSAPQPAPASNIAQSPAAKRRRTRRNCIDLDLIQASRFPQELSSGDEVQFKQHAKPPAPPPPPQAPAPQPAEKKQGAVIEEQFECQICKELMVASHSLVPCGHMFCGECIAEWLQKKPSCPICRARITAAPVSSLAVDNMLDGLVGSVLDKDSQAERERRKAVWAKQGTKISRTLQAVGSRINPQARAHPTSPLHATARAMSGLIAGQSLSCCACQPVACTQLNKLFFRGFSLFGAHEVYSKCPVVAVRQRPCPSTSGSEARLSFVSANFEFGISKNWSKKVQVWATVWSTIHTQSELGATGGVHLTIIMAGLPAL